MKDSEPEEEESEICKIIRETFEEFSVKTGISVRNLLIGVEDYCKEKRKQDEQDELWGPLPESYDPRNDESIVR